MHSHTIRDSGFWTERCWHTGRSLSSLGHGVCDFQQECQIWTRLTIEHFSNLKPSILNEPWPTGHDSASGPCSHMASFLHDIALVGICRWLDCVYSGFWKYSWAHVVMSMTESCRWVMQCRLRARRPRASNKGLRPCPLCTEISPVSLNLLMLCTVDDEICKAFAIWCWGTLFLKYSTIFLHTLSQIGEPTSERLCLSKTINLISCFYS